MNATLEYFIKTYGDVAVIAYDGDCPMCKRYVRWVKFKELTKAVRMVNLRELPKEVLATILTEYDLDGGMLFILDGRLYYGDEAVHRLALLSSGSTLFNRMNRAIFSDERLSKMIYPWLVRGRLVLLKLLGKDTIHG